MARLIDFFWDRSSVVPSVPPAPVVAPVSPSGAPRTPPPRMSPETLIEDDSWSFTPTLTDTSRVFQAEDVHSAALIYIARSLGRLADDVEQIRKHMTRLQLVMPQNPSDQEPR